MHGFRFVCAFVSIFIFPFAASYACWDYNTNSYFINGEEHRVLEMPEASFHHELSKILRDMPTTGLYGSGDDSEWTSTLDADVSDLRDALTNSGMKKDVGDALLVTYREIRNAMFESGRVNKPGTFAVLPLVPRPVFDLAPFKDVFDAIPNEFALYAKGAAAYRGSDVNEAIKQWRALLTLPEDQRKYRSTWAAYMLGGALSRTDSASSKQYFEQARALAKAGFHDSLHLASESIGSQARMELYYGSAAGALKLYADMANQKDPSEAGIGYVSLRIASNVILKRNPIPAEVAQDELCRKILSAWVIANPGTSDLGAKWIVALRDARVNGPLPEAGLIAWGAYNAGDMGAASKWVESAAADDLYAKWVHAKLLLRDGKIDAAIALLRDLSNAFPASERWAKDDYLPNDDPESRAFHEVFYSYGGDRVSSKNMVQAELGVLLLSRSDYINAFDQLIHSTYWLDAAYVAERVLTLDELKTFIDAHANDKTLQVPFPIVDPDTHKMTRYEALRYLFARRLVRAGKWEAALPYYPEFEKEDATKLAAEMKAVAKPPTSNWSSVESVLATNWWNRKSLPSVDRQSAEHLCNAGILMRWSGMELAGTELDPDFKIVDGQYSFTNTTDHRAYRKVPYATFDHNPGAWWSIRPPMKYVPAVAQALSASPDELARVKQNGPDPNVRFHYRCTAIAFLYKSAEMVPNNDPIGVKALYWGGRVARWYDEDMSDRFYKALVYRNRKIPYAQYADKEHWFPEKPPE